MQDQSSYSSDFLSSSQELLDKFWPRICNTTENIITGVICTLTIVKLNLDLAQYSTICNFLGIRLSPVYYHLKHSLGITGFQGFKRSAHLKNEIL